jgi:hypothetical protein
MTDYIDVFSSATVPTAEASFSSYTLAANATFNWQYNYSGTGYVLAKNMEINCSVAGVVMTMPYATAVSEGETVLIRNTGAETLTLKKSGGAALATVAAGAAVMLMVTENSTAAGTWSVTTYGTGSSAADAATLAGYGLVADGTVLNAAHPVETQAGDWSIDEFDRSKAFVYTGGAGTASLPAVSTVTSTFFFMVRNAGTGTLTLEPSGAETIDDTTNMGLNPGESTIVVCSGTEWFTIGYGRSLVYQFTQLVKDVTVGGSFTLTPAEASNKLLTFTGTPGVGVTIIVPTVVSIYYVYNNLDTAQTITIKTASGAGATAAQSQRAIVFCDAADVLSAQTATVSGAIALEDGSAAGPSMNFASESNTGLYKVTGGFGVAAVGVSAALFDAAGFTVQYGYCKVPSATTPSQTAEGALVWDNDSDVMTVGYGAGRKTFVDTDSAQTLTTKTLTSPVLNGTVSAFTSGAINGTTIPTSKTLVTTDDTIAIAKGGTGQNGQAAAFNALAPTTTKGDLIVRDNTGNVRVAVGTNGYYLKADSGAAAGVSWGAVAAPQVTLAGVETLTNKTLLDVKLLTFTAEYDNGSSGSSKMITWTNGQYQKLTMTASCTVTFDFASAGPGHYQLKVKMSNTSAYAITWSTGTPAEARWLGNGSSPALYTGNSAYETLFNFYYDGTNCYGSGAKVDNF